MMIVSVLVLVAVISSGNAQLSPSCNQTKIDDCMSKANTVIANITSLFNHGSTVAPSSLTTSTVQVMCANQNVMKQVLRCTSKAISDCTTSGMSGTLPNTDSLVDSISYLCQNKDDIDLACVATNSMNASTCKTAAAGPGTQPSSDDIAAYICSVESAAVACYDKAFSVCSAKTAQIMTKYLSYQSPAVCDGTTAACDGTIVKLSWALLVISLCYTWIKSMV